MKRARKKLHELMKRQAMVTAAVKAATVVEDDIMDFASRQRLIESMQIKTEDSGRGSLIMNASQEKLWHAILQSWERKERARLIVLKSRRMGTSTFIEAVCYASVLMLPERNAKVVAHDWDSSKSIFAMAHMFHQYLSPQWKERRPLLSATNHMLKWGPPHGSVFSVATANRPHLARGELIHYLHLSELAFWEDPHDPLTSVLQCVPKHNWDTMIAIESTANGAHNVFHNYWTAAESGKNGFTPVFLSWKEFPTYSLPGLKVTLDSTEREFKETHGLTNDQAAWAVDTRISNCHNSWHTFHQEYPIVAEVAFRFSGYPWFSPDIMKLARDAVREPMSVGRMEFVSPSDPAAIFVEDKTGRVSIWEMPDPNAAYVIGMDVSEGVGASNTIITVLKLGASVNHRTEQVACFRSNKTRADDAGVVAFQMGVFYNAALLGIERNNHGSAALAVCDKGHGQFPQMRAGYPYLYCYAPPNRTADETSRLLGWRTDVLSKPKMLHHLASVINRNNTIMRSAETLYEFEGFCYEPEKEQWIQKSQDPATELPLDDEVFAYAIALQMGEYYFTHRAIPRPKDGAF